MSVKQQAMRFIEVNLWLSLLGQIPGSHARARPQVPPARWCWCSLVHRQALWEHQMLSTSARWSIYYRGINTSCEVTRLPLGAVGQVMKLCIYLQLISFIWWTRDQFLLNQLCELLGRKFLGTGAVACFKPAVKIIILIWGHWAILKHMLEKRWGRCLELKIPNTWKSRWAPEALWLLYELGRHSKCVGSLRTPVGLSCHRWTCDLTS